MLKKTVLDKFINKEINRKDAGLLLQMHPNAISRLKKKYIRHGIPALVPKKPGPKKDVYPACNRTDKETEDIVVALALKYNNLDLYHCQNY